MVERNQPRAERMLKQAAEAADTNPDDQALSLEEMEESKTLAEYKETAEEIKRLWERPDAYYLTCRAIEAVAKEYKVRPLTMLKWIGIEPQPDFDQEADEIIFVDKRMKMVIWNYFFGLGEIPPQKMEIEMAVGDEKEAAHVIIDRIEAGRDEQNVRESMRRREGLCLGEYMYNSEVLEDMAETVGMSKRKMPEAVKRVFIEKFGTDKPSIEQKIPMTEMMEALRKKYHNVDGGSDPAIDVDIQTPPH